MILLYAPSFFLRLLLSPTLNSTGIILLFLLKLGVNERLCGIRIHDSSANERLEKESDCSEPRFLDHKEIHYDKSSNNVEFDDLSLYSSFGLDSTSLEPRFLDLVDYNQTHKESMPNSSLEVESNQVNLEFELDLSPESNYQGDCHEGELLDTLSMKTSHVVEKEEIIMEMDSIKIDRTIKFLEWNMKAPLEIIYEAYEGEEEEDDEYSNETNMISSDTYVMRCERYPSLSIYYPESETDSSSDDDFPINKRWERHDDNAFFKWEAEENEKEGLIEISLDRYGKRSIEFCQDEEDNLIEIDIFPQEIE